MEALSQGLSVALVFGLLGAVVWWLRRRGVASISALPRRRAGVLQSVDRLSLTPNHTLHIVRFGERALVLASSPAGCQVIETAPWPPAGLPETPA